MTVVQQHRTTSSNNNKRKKYYPVWISYLGEDAFYANFSTCSVFLAPGTLVDASLLFFSPGFLLGALWVHLIYGTGSAVVLL